MVLLSNEQLSKLKPAFIILWNGLKVPFHLALIFCSDMFHLAMIFCFDMFCHNSLVKSDVTRDVTSISGSKRSDRSEKQTTMAEPVNLFTITSFFSEAPLRVIKGLNSFNSDRVMSEAVLPGGIIKGSVQASMKKKVYEVGVSQKLAVSWLAS